MRKPHLLLVASTGGHIKQLHNLKAFWEKYDRTWVTFKTANSPSLLKDEKNIIWASFPTNYPNFINNLKNLFMAFKTVLFGKYTHIISTGAGVGVGFIAFGWLLGPIKGVKSIFIDSLTRTKGISLSMKLVYWFSNLRLTQWENNIKKYPRLIYKGKVI